MVRKKDIFEILGTEEGEIGKGRIFERIVYDFVSDCREAVKNNNIMAFCNLVELFYTNLVYSNKKTDKEFNNLTRQWNKFKLQEMLSDGQKSNTALSRFQFAMKKYRIICQLLKSKNLYPKPSENEWF